MTHLDCLSALSQRGEHRLRAYLEQVEISYVLGIPKNTEVTDRAGGRATIEHCAARLAPND